MSLPQFDHHTGFLPKGEWPAEWNEIVERFGMNPERRILCDSLHQALFALKTAGCTKAWSNGSFITDKTHPGDVDVLYRARGLQPRLLPDDFRNKEARKVKYRGDYIPVDDETHDPDVPQDLFKFFGTARSGEEKGIVTINLASLPAPITTQ